MSIPASCSSIYPSPSCVICMGGGDRSLYIIGIRTCSYYVYFIYSSEVSTRICVQLFSSVHKYFHGVEPRQLLNQ